VGFELEPLCGREQRGSPQAKSRPAGTTMRPNPT
jgi:hypothetical protein